MHLKTMKNHFIGIMTGTSVDAIDVAELFINKEECKLLNAQSFQFPEKMRNKILEISRNKAVHDNSQISSLSDELAYIYAESIDAFIYQSNIDRESINAVGIHGQTISHKPDEINPSSIQIGNGEIVAKETGLIIVSDFRSADILAGGQGAPLAPLFHNRFFGKKDTTRAVINIGEDMPSSEAISANMEALADYAKIVQNNNMVPMVEPEVLMDGNHSIDDCFEATSRCLDALFTYLLEKGVDIKGTILKPNMVTSGSNYSDQADVEEVARKTIDCLKAYVPDDLPGITFLSGGQSDIDATAHLDAMNKIGGFNWKLSFSYGRALQQPALKAWMGKIENSTLAQQALSHRALMNKLASEGKWDISLEN